MSDAKDAQRASTMEATRGEDAQEGDASLNGMSNPCCMHPMSCTDDLFGIPRLLA